MNLAKDLRAHASASTGVVAHLGRPLLDVNGSSHRDLAHPTDSPTFLGATR